MRTLRVGRFAVVSGVTRWRYGESPSHCDGAYTDVEYPVRVYVCVCVCVCQSSGQITPCAFCSSSFLFRVNALLRPDNNTFAYRARLFSTDRLRARAYFCTSRIKLRAKRTVMTAAAVVDRGTFPNTVCPRRRVNYYFTSFPWRTRRLSHTCHVPGPIVISRYVIRSRWSVDSFRRVAIAVSNSVTSWRRFRRFRRNVRVRSTRSIRITRFPFVVLKARPFRE